MGSEVAEIKGLPENIGFSRSGALLLTGGQHGVLSRFTGKVSCSDDSIEFFWNNQGLRQKYCDNLGIEYKMVVFPDKLVPFSDEVSDGVRSIYIESYGYANPINNVLYLSLGKEDFARTDTHLSYDGIISACIQSVSGIVDFEAEDFRNICQGFLEHDPCFIGDLGVQCSPKISEDTYLLRRPKHFRFATNGLSGGNYGIIDINVNSQAASGKCLLIFGDSFFRQILVGLGHLFEKIVFMRTRFFHEEMIAAINPDVIFCGSAERFFSDVQPDSVRPHFLALPLMNGRATNPSASFAELWAEVVDSRALAGSAG